MVVQRRSTMDNAEVCRKIVGALNPVCEKEGICLMVLILDKERMAAASQTVEAQRAGRALRQEPARKAAPAPKAAAPAKAKVEPKPNNDWTLPHSASAAALFAYLNNWTLPHSAAALFAYLNNWRDKGTLERLAKAFHRTPGAVSWKINNIKSFDPKIKAKHITGAKHASGVDKQAWEMYKKHPRQFSNLAKKTLKTIFVTA